jgi:hypothetical protein
MVSPILIFPIPELKLLILLVILSKDEPKAMLV